MKQRRFLEKTFSRQKSLIYIMMWDVSERLGYKNFINYDLKASLFIYDSKTEKTSVWYDPEEAGRIERLLAAKVKTSKNFITQVIKQLNFFWKKIFPYLSDKKEIKTVIEFKKYYQDLTAWWSAMNTVYPLINNPDISARAGKVFLTHRKSSERYTGRMDGVMLDFLDKKIDKKYRDLVNYILADEAAKLIAHDIKENEIKRIKDRKRGFIIFKENIYKRSELKSILIKRNLSLRRKKIKPVKEFRGMPAFPGKAKGIVRRIMVKKDIEKFRDKEILVAETTCPDYVAYMRKASAFITDEGGITCHAAVTARELKTPCVVGTKIATTILKNGDLVEVDANQGIVKIIK